MRNRKKTGDGGCGGDSNSQESGSLTAAVACRYDTDDTTHDSHLDILVEVV